MIKKYNLSFKPIQRRHLPLLLKWLNSSHVQQFWDTGTIWTEVLVEEKYGSYIEGYKQFNGKKLPMQAFIFYEGDQPIGYIQLYKASDYTRDGYSLSVVLKNTPFDKCRLAAIDLFIGELDYVGKGIGSSILKQFLNEFVWKNFDGCLVDPDHGNHRAIRAYEKAGFVQIKAIPNPEVVIMISQKSAEP